MLLNQTSYKKLPELQDGLQWDDFSMSNISKTINVNIRYFPEKNFFLVSNYKALGHFNPIKIDSAGNKTFELDLREKDPFKFLESINCFVIGANSIVDFSADKPETTPFNEVINKDGNLTDKDWVEMFNSLYSTSAIVLYGYRTDLEPVQAVYFQNQEKWTKLYTSKNGRSFIFSEAGGKIVCKINGKEIQPKWHASHFLKDVQNATFSNEHRYTDNYITPFNADKTFFPDQALIYQSAGTIKTLGFTKETYTSEGYYNPGIPVNFYGTGYFALEIGNATLKFKTVASKTSFGGKIESDLYLFGLHEKYANQTDVRFLTYDYGTNFHENGRKGVYVIKRNQ
ncbi:MAG: hypothetical protein EOP00_27310 [Pedobacter sp.]|nr:MAG: hypothetical protein EOP00_27310 [Pedobacter sp.]